MKIFGLEIRKVKNSTNLVPISTQTYGGTWYNNPRLSTGELLANTTVTACVNLIADAVAGLSCNVYKKTPKGRVIADELPLEYILKRVPNYEDTPFTFKQKVMLHLLLKGNAFIFIERNPDDSIRALYALDPDKVEIKRDEKKDVYYVYTCDGKQYKYNTHVILHIPAIRYNSIRGLSPIEYATHAARVGLDLEEYTAKYYDGGIHSKLVITAPERAGKLSKEDIQHLQEQVLHANGGRENVNKPLIFSNGFTVNPLDIEGKGQSQLVENRTFSEKEIAKIFRVPLYMLGKDDAKFTNTEQMNTFFLQQTLTPWLIRLQEYFNRLIRYDMQDICYVEFDTNTLLRTDAKTKIDLYTKQLINGQLSLNDINRKENRELLPAEIGDVHFIAANLMPLTKENIDAYMSAQKNALNGAPGNKDAPKEDKDEDEENKKKEE